MRLPFENAARKLSRRKQSPCGIKQYLVHRKTVFSDSLDNDACNAAHRHNHGRHKAQRFPPFIGACICGRPGISACLVSFFINSNLFQLKTLQRNFTVKIGQNQKTALPASSRMSRTSSSAAISMLFCGQTFPRGIRCAFCYAHVSSA